MNPLLHFYSSLHVHVYYLIWCSSQSCKENSWGFFFVFCVFFFFSSQKSNFLAAWGRKGYSTELAFLFKTTFHIRLFLQPGWVKPEAGVLLFLDCYQHLTPSAVLLHQSLQCPHPRYYRSALSWTCAPRSRLLQLPERATHPAPRGCAPRIPPPPTFVQTRVAGPSQPPRMYHGGKTQLPGNSRPDFLKGWLSRLSFGRGLVDFCVLVLPWGSTIRWLRRTSPTWPSSGAHTSCGHPPTPA